MGQKINTRKCFEHRHTITRAVHSPKGFLGTPVKFFKHMAVASMHLGVLSNSKPNVRMGKKGDFEHSMMVGARWAGLSISQYAQLLGFSRTTIVPLNMTQ